MADLIDRAADAADLLLDVALASRPALPVGVSPLVCDDCGEPIPEDRRLALPGCRMCVSCQQDAEERAHHGR